MEHGAAIDAVVRYALEVASLPAVDAALLDLDAADTSAVRLDSDASVLKPLVTDVVTGEVLPRVDNAWLVMTPFEDMGESISAPAKRDWTQKRRGLLELLATLACSTSSPFRLDALSAFKQRHRVAPQGNATGTFWKKLMRKLDPASHDGSTDTMDRCLIAMSHTRLLRFMLCITQETVPTELVDLLEVLLEPLSDGESVKRWTDVLETCGIAGTSIYPVTVDIGLSFPRAKISPVLMTKLFDVLARHSSQPSTAGRVTLRVRSLRFGSGCVLQPKAIEVLSLRQTYLAIADLRFGLPQEIKPVSMRLSLTGTLRQQGLRRLSLTSANAFVAIASTLRSSDTRMTELECAYEPTAESAAWLAFALFHADSPSRVSSLRLRFPLCTDFNQLAKLHDGAFIDEWVTAFKRALRSTTAKCELARVEDGDDEDDQEPSARRFITIEGGTPVRVEPHTSGKIACEIDDSIEEVEAIATVNNFVAVIVPGQGIGWVPAASVLSEKVVSTRLLRAGSHEFQTNRRIKSLVWDCRTSIPFYRKRPLDGHVKLLMETLRIVGEPLTRLHAPKLRLTADEITQVLEFCPNLTDLNISGHEMTTIAPLVNAYTTGRCRIETLSLARTGTWVLSDSIPKELSAFLNGPQSRDDVMMRYIEVRIGPQESRRLYYGTLRRLGVHLTPHTLGWGTSSTSSTSHENATLELARVLGRCRTLECFRVFGSSLWANGQPRSQLNAAVDVSAQPLCFSPTSTAAKLAFLSCLHSEHSISALHRLDVSVLVQIFRFCDHVVARQVLTGAPVPSERDA